MMDDSVVYSHMKNLSMTWVYFCFVTLREAHILKVIFGENVDENVEYVYKAGLFFSGTLTSHRLVW